MMGRSFYALHLACWTVRVVDSSEGKEPLQFIQGMGHIIRGLEHQLYDMKIGEKKDVVVTPKTDMEKRTPKHLWMCRAIHFRRCSLKPGTELELRDQSDQPVLRALTRSAIRMCA